MPKWTTFGKVIHVWCQKWSTLGKMSTFGIHDLLGCLKPEPATLNPKQCADHVFRDMREEERGDHDVSHF